MSTPSLGIRVRISFEKSSEIEGGESMSKASTVIKGKRDGVSWKRGGESADERKMDA
jgi:hypothetical protein